MRIEPLLQYIEEFIYDYFDQNPISQMGVIITRNGVAEKLTELSGIYIFIITFTFLDLGFVLICLIVFL